MRKVLIGLILVILIIIVAGHFGVQWAERKIKKEVDAISFLSYDSLEINAKSRSLRVVNLRGTKDGYKGQVDVLSIKGLKLWPILSGKKFIVEEVMVQGVSLSYRMNSRKKAANQSKKKMDSIPEFRIKKIDLTGGDFSLRSATDAPVFKTQLSVLLENLTNTDIRNPGRIPAKLTRMEADSSVFFSTDGLYRVNVNQSVFENQSIRMRKVSLKSEYDKMQLARHVGHEVDWMDASVDSIVLKIANLETILKTPLVHKLELYHPELHVFRDKRLPFPKNHYPPLLRDVLAKENIQFGFDSIRIEDGEVTYEEFVKEEKGPGVLNLLRMDADITNLKSYSLQSSERARLIATCSLYDQAQLFADISFPKSAQENRTLVKGKLMPIDLTAFNRMIRYVSVIEIKSGKSKMLEFDFSYTDTQSSGEMKFAYNDLMIEFLEKQESEPDGVISAVKSFFVNSFVIDRNNDFESDKFRLGKVNFERAKEKSMFNYWWGSILTGFKSSTGVDASGEKIDVN